jgi:anti-anti-sigma factor
MQQLKGLELRTEPTADGLRMSLHGELDLSTSVRLREELDRLEDNPPSVIVLDLRAVDFMDSSGLQLILGADARARASGRRVQIIASPRVERVFRITRTHSRLDFVDDARNRQRGDEQVADAPRMPAEHTSELAVPAVPPAVTIARRAVRSLSAALTEEELEDMLLVVSELVTNSVRHANLGPHQPIRVRLCVSPSRIRGEVSNPGAGFDVEMGPGPGGDTGWGLYLVDRLCDRWSVLSSGDATTVWFERDREVAAPRREAPARP